MNVENLLFIDTETNEDTQEIDCITYLIGDKMGIIENFDEESFKFLRDLWHFSDGVVFYNAPFDMGVLSKAYDYNAYNWVEKEDSETGVISSYWDMLLFGHRYKVKKLSFTANFINPMARKNVVPIIDLLKLWNILIETSSEKVSISLKSLINRHLNWENGAIEYSKENAKMDKYRIQDVIAPKELMYIFLDKIKDVDVLNNFTATEWGSIKSSATFSKLFYAREYDNLKDIQQENDACISKYKLSAALEKAYHGGLTFAFYRGDIDDCAWVDIKGAYANAMKFLNTDQYLLFDFEKVDNFDMDSPYLLYVKSNFVFDTIENGLKTFYVHKPFNNWVWNYDIKAIENLIDDYEYEIIEVYKIIPQNDVKESLPLIWDSAKNIEEKKNGKSTLYNFYKLLSNSSYGIKAQRIPTRTEHTNMVIAGIITSRAHLVLTTINKTLRNEGFKIVYNDTDSACFHFDIKDIDEPFDLTVIDRINKAIHPFVVDYEGVFHNNNILSLKRYICEESEMYESVNKKLIGKIPDMKIRVHGKGQYEISSDDMYLIASGEELDEDAQLNIKQFTGTTKRTLKRIMVEFPHFESELRPFMFIRNTKSHVWRSTYLKKWVDHIDKKLTHKNSINYDRTFRKFFDRDTAVIFYKNISSKKDILYGSNMTNTFINWDAYEKELSDEFIEQINNKHIITTKKAKDIDPIIEFYCSKCNCGLIIGKNILKSRFKDHIYICNKCFKNPENRTPTNITNEKKDKQIRALKLINDCTVREIKTNKNKSQEQIMIEHDKEMQDNDKRIKEIRKRLEDKENNYQKKLKVRKEKKKTKPKSERKIKKDEKKFCKKCNVLLNPYVNGNITMRDYKQSRYVCLNCKKEILKQKREQKQIIKNSR